MKHSRINTQKTQIDDFAERLRLIGQMISAQQDRNSGKKEKCYSNIVKKYKNMYFQELARLSDNACYYQLEKIYEESNWEEEPFLKIKNLKQQITKLQQKQGNQRRICNFSNIVSFICEKQYNASKQTQLSQIRALKRFECIQAGSICYNSHLYFTKNNSYYKGMTEITFKLTTIPYILRLDCFNKDKKSIYINDKRFDGRYYQLVLIDRKYLRMGRNIIIIDYENQFNQQFGCITYSQTVNNTKNQYIYTKFGIFGAHYFLPCFDQPDLKASFTFNIIFPDQWIALSNEKPSIDKMKYTDSDYLSKVATKDKRFLQLYADNKTGKFSVFKITQPVSTYHLCMVIGDYYSITANVIQRYKNVRTTLYCIHSCSNYLKRLAPFIFEVVKISLAFYQETFGAKYPFLKYDLVFCPEFKSQGNYNVGIITFDDTYLCPEDEMSAQKLLQLAIEIARQNALNWLAILVEMKWWDQLWFSESFADFIAHYCIEKIKDKLTIIPKYYSPSKQSLVKVVTAFKEDRSWETTHAVSTRVINTDIASSYLDCIAKYKGSAIIKQLMFLMGEDCFFKGVKDYFKKFGLKESSVNDFFTKMQNHFTRKDFTLDQWRKSWLQTRSFNIISVKFDPSKITQEVTLTIRQKSETSFYPTLRYHKTRVAFFKEDGTYDVLEVLLTPTATTKLKYNGSNHYKAVLVNVDNWGHFQYIIDPVSFQFFKDNINRITNGLTRMIIWHYINEQVRTPNSRLNIKVADFILFFRQHIHTEYDEQILRFQYRFAKEAINSYISIPQRAALKKIIYDQTLKALIAAKQPNRIKLLKDKLIAFANSHDSIQVMQLQNWRNGSCKELQPFPITGSQGWEIIKIIYSVTNPHEFNPQQKFLKYKDQYIRFPGIKAQMTLNTCNAITADSVGMDAIFSQCLEKNFSLITKASYVQGWINLGHLEQLISIYKQRYFRVLRMQFLRNRSHFDYFAENLKPIDDNLQETFDELQNILNQRKLSHYQTAVFQDKSEDQNKFKDETTASIRKIQQIRFEFVLRSHLYKYNV